MIIILLLALIVLMLFFMLFGSAMSEIGKAPAPFRFGFLGWIILTPIFAIVGVDFEAALVLGLSSGICIGLITAIAQDKSSDSS